MPTAPFEAPPPPPEAGADRYYSPPEKAVHADESARPDESVGEMFAQLRLLLEELKTYASYWLSAKIDSAKWTITKIVLYAIAGVIGAMVAVTALVTTVILLMVGLATALGRAFGPGMWWLGWIIVGGVILLAIVGGLWWMLSSMSGSRAKRLAKEYELKRKLQQERFGNHVRSRAADQA